MVIKPPPHPIRQAYSVRGARPVARAPTTETGFLALISLDDVQVELAADGVAITFQSPHQDDGVTVRWQYDATPLFGDFGSYRVPVYDLQSMLQRRARPVRGGTDMEAWRDEVAGDILVESLVAVVIQGDMRLLSSPRVQMLRERAIDLWEDMKPGFRRLWARWLRRHTGMQRLELAVDGFFENGGKVAQLCYALYGPRDVDEDTDLDPAQVLQVGFDGIKDLSMICAPGLDEEWQKAILDYAGPKGRADLFAILDGPPLYTHSTRPAIMAPYAIAPLPTDREPHSERPVGDAGLDSFIIHDESGFGAAFGPWLLVDNPSSLTPDERYVLAPPSGHVAGAIAGSDLATGGGVHAPLANISIVGVTEPGYLFTADQHVRLIRSGINPLVWQPRAGVRITGEYSLATDPKWRLVNSRRIWLFVVRSLREGLRWAAHSRSAERLDDMEATVAGFLDQLYRERMLEGDSRDDAWAVERGDNGALMVWIRPVGMSERVRVAIHTEQ